MEVANKELFTYHEGNMGVTVKQLFPRVNSYNIEVVFKYVSYEKKFVKKYACMVKNPFTGRMQFLVPINGNQTKAINVEQFYMGLY